MPRRHCSWPCSPRRLPRPVPSQQPLGPGELARRAPAARGHARGRPTAAAAAHGGLAAGRGQRVSNGCSPSAARCGATSRSTATDPRRRRGDADLAHRRQPAARHRTAADRQRHLAGDRSWAEVAVYVVVIRYVLKDFGSVGKFMSGLSRQFGPVERYIRFVRSAAWPMPSRRCRPGRGGPLALRARHLAGGTRQLLLGPAGCHRRRDHPRPPPGRRRVLLVDHARAAPDGAGAGGLDRRRAAAGGRAARWPISPLPAGLDPREIEADAAASPRRTIRSLSARLAAPDGGAAADTAAGMADLRAQGRCRQASRRRAAWSSRATRSRRSRRHRERPGPRSSRGRC